jgi:hypothetical protein
LAFAHFEKQFSNLFEQRYRRSLYLLLESCFR